MGENLHKDNLEEFFRNSFQESDQNLVPDDWDLPDDNLWDDIAGKVGHKNPTSVVSLFSANWKKWTAIAASLLILVVAFCFYQNQQMQLDELNVKVSEQEMEIERMKERSIVNQENEKSDRNENNKENDLSLDTESGKKNENEKDNQGAKNLPLDPPQKKDSHPDGGIVFSMSSNSEHVQVQNNDSLQEDTSFNNQSVNHQIKHQQNERFDLSDPIAKKDKNSADEKNQTNVTLAENQIPENEIIDKNEIMVAVSSAKTKAVEQQPENKLTDFAFLNSTKKPLIESQIKEPTFPVIPNTDFDFPEKKKQFYIGLTQGIHKIKYRLQGAEFLPPAISLPEIKNKKHPVYTTGIKLGAFLNRHWSIEAGFAYGLQSGNTQINRRGMFSNTNERQLPDGRFESETAVQLYTSHAVEETDIVLTRLADDIIREGQPISINIDISEQRHFIRIPLLLKYTNRLAGPLNWSASAGIASNISLVQKRTIQQISTDIRELEVSPRDRSVRKKGGHNSIDFVVAAGIEFPISNNWTISLEPGYNIGLSKVKQNQRTSIRSNTANLELGIRYRF